MSNTHIITTHSSDNIDNWGPFYGAEYKEALKVAFTEAVAAGDYFLGCDLREGFNADFDEFFAWHEEHNTKYGFSSDFGITVFSF